MMSDQVPYGYSMVIGERLALDHRSRGLRLSYAAPAIRGQPWVKVVCQTVQLSVGLVHLLVQPDTCYDKLADV